MKHLKLFEAHDKIIYKPNEFGILNLDNMQLTYLSEIPENVRVLRCNHNNLTALPKFHDGLTHLLCVYNKLTSLPELPDSLVWLLCHNNPLECLIPKKFVRNQESEWLLRYYYPYIRSYEGQKKILTDTPDQVKELEKQTKIVPKIKKEFHHLFAGAELNLL